jgi:hypothetical protein
MRIREFKQDCRERTSQCSIGLVLVIFAPSGAARGRASPHGPQQYSYQVAPHGHGPSQRQRNAIIIPARGPRYICMWNPTSRIVWVRTLCIFCLRHYQAPGGRCPGVGPQAMGGTTRIGYHALPHATRPIVYISVDTSAPVGTGMLAHFPPSPSPHRCTFGGGAHLRSIANSSL